MSAEAFGDGVRASPPPKARQREDEVLLWLPPDVGWAELMRGPAADTPLAHALREREGEEDRDRVSAFNNYV